MIALGITGRSGCGKSTVTAVFSAHGVPLADADQISREILLPGSPLLPRLAQRFGADILKADGTLDRRLLADRAFATPEGKAALDSLTWRYFPTVKWSGGPVSLLTMTAYLALCAVPVILDRREDRKWTALRWKI